MQSSRPRERQESQSSWPDTRPKRFETPLEKNEIPDGYIITTDEEGEVLDLKALLLRIVWRERGEVFEVLKRVGNLNSAETQKLIREHQQKYKI